MTRLLYEFKQGNKILTKIYEVDNIFRCSIGGLSFDYDLLVNAVLKTHDYIAGLLSIRKNKSYVMLHYQYISQYAQVYKYTYNNGELVQEGYLYKTMIA